MLLLNHGRFQCLDKDCRKIVGEGCELQPQVHGFIARTYPAGTYGKTVLTEDKTFPAYEVVKCPYCRGNLRALEWWEDRADCGTGGMLKQADTERAGKA